MKNSLVQRLQKLGLDEREALVYVALLQMKKGTALTIAKATELKRPTTYMVLERLKQKKLVSETTFRNVRDYRALSPEHIRRYVRTQQQAAETFLPYSKKLYAQRPVKLRLRTWEGVEALKSLLEKMLDEDGPIYILGSQEKFIAVLGEYWEFFLKRARQRTRLPYFKEYNGEAALLLWSDKAAFAHLDDTVQSFGFKNKELYEMYRKIWNNF